MSGLNNHRQQIGEMIRTWRLRRRYSQLALALEADISQRHLSFLESGRSQPSREMLLRLAEFLHVPLRETNSMLVAAGFAPVYSELAFDAPQMKTANAVIERILNGHNPHPALALDRYWNIIAANSAVSVLTAGVDPSLLVGEVNALRLTLHPNGMAARILNLSEWRSHILSRLARDIELSADPRLGALYDELNAYPVPACSAQRRNKTMNEPAIAVPLIIKSPQGPLEFISTTTVFGTSVDVTLSDLVIESFFACNPQTAAAMSKLTGEN